MVGLDMSNGEYKKLWSKFDTTGVGYITYAAFNNKVGLLIHPRSDVVLNRPETPKVKEWQRKALARGIQKKMQNLEEAFKEIDTDGSGRISHQEFIQALRKLGLTKVGHEESYQMMTRKRRADNHTGEMTLEEFKDTMMEYLRSTFTMAQCAWWCGIDSLRNPSNAFRVSLAPGITHTCWFNAMV